MGWIGVDLDRTLAKYEEWKGETHIGEPIPLMVERVKKWLADGIEVRIFTARVARNSLNLDGSLYDVSNIRTAIQDWCYEHVGARLQVTCQKDYAMIELWDDLAVGVIPNTGERQDGKNE